MKSGILKFFHEKKGYGFITQADSTEIFFHVTGVECDPKQLVEGAIVNYTIGKNKKGIIAEQVTVQ